MSRPTKTKTGHAEIDHVEQMFINMGFQKNKNIRNKQGTKKARELVIEGFYNHKDRRRIPVKKLYGLFVDQLTVPSTRTSLEVKRYSYQATIWT